MTAHIGGVPIEETLASFGPALLVALGAMAAKLRARYVRVREPSRDVPIDVKRWKEI